ncbi:MAG: FAD binding domain-containing protein [Dehalococcoidia bacterium]
MINEFEHVTPTTLKDALTSLEQYGEDCKVICGGQSLLVLMRQGLVAPEYIVDIKGVSELDYIQADSDGGVRIGGTTTHREIENSSLIQEKFPVLAKMEKRLASVQTRNWGTIGGNVCHGDPAGDPAPVMITLGASVKLASAKGERTMAVEDFTLDFFETALEEGELLVEFQIPAPKPHTGAAYTKFNIIQSDLATVGAGISITLGSDKETCEDARIGLASAGPTPLRAKQAEEKLRGKKLTEKLLQEAGEAASEEAEPLSDIAASEEYRRELIKILVKRMGNEAWTQAKQR